MSLADDTQAQASAYSARSVRGEITSAWRREGDALHLEVELPPNVTGTVVVPGGERVEVGSGRHVFTAAVSPVG